LSFLLLLYFSCLFPAVRSFSLIAQFRFGLFHTPSFIFMAEAFFCADEICFFESTYFIHMSWDIVDVLFIIYYLFISSLSTISILWTLLLLLLPLRISVNELARSAGVCPCQLKKF